MLKTVAVCDKCGEPGETYKIVLPGSGRAHEVELCTRHAKPLTDLAARGREVRLPKVPRQTVKVTRLKE